MKILFAATAFAVLLSGCAINAPAYTPRYETLDQLKKAPLDKIALGDFQPNDSGAAVNRITLRGSPLTAAGGSYADYLETALRSDLQEMGFYDPASPLRVDATLLKNDIDVLGFSTGTGEIEARLSVARQGQRLLDKTYAATISFESSFLGAVAIPRGQAEYPNLVRALLQKVYADPEFIRAVTKP